MTEPTKPRVTIGVPVKNGAPALRQALESIVGQDAEGLDILISDNASTDETPAIIEEFRLRDPRIRVVRHEAPLSALAHLHWVKDRARGEYFMWAAHDDTRSSDTVSVLARALDARPKAVLAFGDLYFSSEPCGVGRPEPFDFETAGLSTAGRMRKAAFGECFNIYGLWRTSAIQQVPLAHSPWWLDLPLMTSAAVLGEFIHVPGPRFSYYRVIKPNEERVAYQDPGVKFGRVRAMLGLQRATWQACRQTGGLAAAFWGVACVTARHALDFPFFLVRRIRERLPRR